MPNEESKTSDAYIDKEEVTVHLANQKLNSMKMQDNSNGNN